MGESSVKCCETMERCAAETNSRHKTGASTGKTRPINGCLPIPTSTASSMDVVRSCTSPPYELDHMYANSGGGAGDGCDANFMRSPTKLLMTASAMPSSSSSSSVTTALPPSSSSTDAQRQLLCMRELVFLHLDLIQQQQDQLDSRERQIAVMRQESDSLKEQLECANVRLAALSKENLKLRGAEFDERERNPSANFPHKTNGNRVRNRNSSCTESPSKRSRHDSEFTGSGSGKKSHRKSSTSAVCQQQQKKDDVLQTDVTYYTCIGTTNVANTPVEDDAVLVPCWRLHPITSCYQLEGTENLDDDIFMKRHQKLEIDEKRRKRWDIQRIREQRLQDKLRKGRQTRDENMRNCSPDLATFFPMADDVQLIEVSDTLPVLAFGYTVPNASNSEFQVPWLNSSDKTWSEIGRASRGSKRGT